MRRLLWLLPLLLIPACNLPKAEVLPTAPVPTAIPVPTPTLRTSGFLEPTLEVAVELPAFSVDIEGVSYTAWQAEGDPFRFVCPGACPGFSQLMYWQYSGFKAAHEIIVQTMGVDVLPELQPVDIHVVEDPKCGTRLEAPEASFAGHEPRRRAYVCSFGLQPFIETPVTPEVAREASRLDHQTELVHAYLHAIFFGRVPAGVGMHDFVTPIAMYVTDTLPGGDLCTYHPDDPPGDYRGWLIYTLCEDDHFEIEDLAPTMKAVDRIYRRGDGRINERLENLVPHMAQFRFELKGALGTDVSGAFADSCWPAELFEDTYDLPSKCWP